MSKKQLTPKEASEAAKALEILFATGFVGRRKLYWENFVRGLTFSVGSIIGATIGLALIIWLLSFFKTVPLIGSLVRNADQTIQRSK